MNVRLIDRSETCPLCGCADGCVSSCPRMEWPRKMDSALLLVRAMLTLAIFAGAFVFYRGTPLPVWLALPPALILAALFVAVLLLVEAAPSKGPGRVVSRGRR
jgi:hypothetical protein